VGRHDGPAAKWWTRLSPEASIRLSCCRISFERFARFVESPPSADLPSACLPSPAGTTLALVAVVRAVTLQPLPFAQPHRTTVIWQYDIARSTPVVEVGLGEAEDWLGDTSPLESVAVFSSVAGSVTLVRNARSRAASALVSSDFFAIIGAQPLLGRVLSAADDDDEAPRTAVISERYWRRVFGGDPSVVGRVETMQWSRNGRPGPVELVGIVPDAFDLPRHTEVWLPAAPALRTIASAAPGERAATRAYYLRYFKIFYALGRLREGLDVREAEHRLAGIVRQRDLPTGRPSGVVLRPLRDYLRSTRPILWLMLGGAALMLLLPCSSVAALQVFRLARQDRALAVQLALGAGRHRLARHVTRWPNVDCWPPRVPSARRQWPAA
jgi:putative ABC transport system permease protein